MAEICYCHLLFPLQLIPYSSDVKVYHHLAYVVPYAELFYVDYRFTYTIRTIEKKSLDSAPDFFLDDSP